MVSLISARPRILPASIARAVSSAHRSLSTLLIAEHDGKVLSQGTLSAVTACAKFGPTTVFVGGDQCKEVAESAAAVAGVDAVKLMEHPLLAHGLSEEWTPVVLSLQETGGYTHIVSAASAFSKGLLPRVAAKLDVAQISDVIDIKDEKTFTRPTYAGNALTTVESLDAVKVLTIRPTNFDTAACEGGSAQVSVHEADVSPAGMSEWVCEDVKKSDRPELATAKTVVSGGRGLKSGENFAMLDALALKLNAAVGASRAAVDSGMCPNDMQVGQTGKVVAPDLYIAVGISGAIQHLAGMKDSKTIVAINKDPDAPIFQIADYGLVEDLFTACPELEKLL